MKTTDYDKFKIIYGNRTINAKHLDKLKASIEQRNLLQANPIIVNKNFEVIDGQHRLLVARSLNVPIYYEVVKDSTLDDVVRLNASQKNWNLMDYVTSYIIRGNNDYATLKTFCEAYNLPVSVGVWMLTGFANHGIPEMKAGDFEIVDYDGALSLVKFAEELEPIMGVPIIKNDRQFLRALRHAKNVGVTAEDLLKKSAVTGKKIQKAGSVMEYTNQLEAIYNWRKGIYTYLAPRRKKNDKKVG